PGRAGTGGKISVVFTASEPLTTTTFDNDGLVFENSVSLDGLTHTYTYGVTDRRGTDLRFLGERLRRGRQRTDNDAARQRHDRCQTSRCLHL
ncbi:MAG TPA: hypothetical protein PKH10_11205, partial [bacterium]|nr:hypothetical protein [bacterium]